MTANEFKALYRHYLINVAGRTKRVAYKYVTYINKVCILPGMQSLWEDLANHTHDQRWQINRVTGLIDAIVLAKNDPHCPISNHLTNGLSATRALLDFVSRTVSTGTASTATTTTATTDIVVYENSNPTCEPIPGLRDYLKNEYKKIREFAQDILGHLWQVFPEIPVYLSEKQPTKTYYYSLDFLLDEMKEKCAKCTGRNCKTPCEADMAILREYAPFVRNICGEFFGGKDPYIVLYFKNFKNPSMHNSNFLAEIANTLAHEYLHYLEYAYCNAHKTIAGKSDNVSEALADFFGMLYSLKKASKEDLVVAKKEYSSWKRYWGSNWPYAYAICFYQVNGHKESYTNQLVDYDHLGMIKKFRDVFASTPDPHAAETRLVSKY